MDFAALRAALDAFADERDWDQFHSPKNLTMALSVEVAELVEHFQWLTEAQSRALPADTSREVADEIADIQIYLVRLADKLDIDIEAAVGAKLAKNAEKYPASRVKGRADKYTRYGKNER